MNRTVAALRKKHPDRVPCLTHLPDGTTMKLLFHKDDTIATFMYTVRKKWDSDTLGPGDALFAICGQKMCTGTTRLGTLDTDPDSTVVFYVKRESTYG